MSAAHLEELIELDDAATGLRGFIAIHSTARGPAFGGVRRMRYASLAEAQADARRLAEAMTLKCALAGLPAGGGKSVLLDDEGLEPDALYRAFGRAVESLGGRYVCGPDVGTGPEAIEAIRTQTAWVNAAGNDAGGRTAQGVYAALRGAMRVLGVGEVRELRVFVQGLGAVGGALAQRLVGEGAQVLGCDPNPQARDASAAAGVEIVDPSALVDVEADVFMPCALGAVLDRDVAETAPWRLICGSANNQLATPDVGERLHERGVLWVPDVVASAGAVIEGVLTSRGRSSEALAEVDACIARIEATTRRVLEGGGAGPSPAKRATRLALEALSS